MIGLRTNRRREWFERPVRLFGLAIALAGLVDLCPARAQNAPVQATPLPPLQQQWDQEGSPPVQEGPRGLQTSPPPAEQPQLGAPNGSAAQTPAPPQGSPDQPAPAPFQKMETPNVWLPATGAKIQALDKVNAQTQLLTVKVGQSTTFGSLTITVKACMTRPTDQAADAAAFLDVQDSHSDSPPFDGWMLAAEPSVSMLQNPVYDLRVTGCT